MPLQHLVEYFNDRFGQEHHSIFRPFILNEGKVSGLFGPVRINSLFSPIRVTSNPTLVVGHTAQIEVSTYGTQQFYENEIEYLLVNNEQQPTGLESIINFDRLSRTVHMLNYLTLMPGQGTLFLEVDPLHILGIKKDHGVYFEDVIAQCGLKTGNIAIVLAVYKQYAKYYQQLLRGLDNYRQKGYQIALKFYAIEQDNVALNLITHIAPNYTLISAKHVNYANDDAVLDNLSGLVGTVTSVKGMSILLQVDQKKTDTLARKAKFNLVEGSYYRAIAFDYLGGQERAGIAV